MEAFGRLVQKLCDASQRQYVNPYTFLDWPQRLDGRQWCTSPEFISIYGTHAYERLNERQRKRLSFYETVNFFSLNIHGEKALVEGLAQRLYRRDNALISPYLHHFLDEENKHMVYFGGFCMRYAGKIYPDRKIVIPREFAPGEEDFLFFAKVMIFEEIVDVYNTRMAKDERLVPIVRQINLIHHKEEARHLVFGREIVNRMFDTHAPKWSTETLRNVREYLQSYFVTTWKEYYNPDVYKDAGLKEPYMVQQRAFSDAACQAHRQAVSKKCLRYLVKHGIVEKEFAV
ncbi:MAG: diiron oxygenase [Nitrospiraceae bacterium]